MIGNKYFSSLGRKYENVESIKRKTVCIQKERINNKKEKQKCREIQGTRHINQIDLLSEENIGEVINRPEFEVHNNVYIFRVYFIIHFSIWFMSF